jgi:hypothetical protein
MTINLDNVLEYYGDITLPIMEEVIQLHPECTHIRLSEHTVIPGTDNLDMIVAKYRELQGL